MNTDHARRPTRFRRSGGWVLAAVVVVAVAASGCSDRSLQDALTGKPRLDTLSADSHVSTPKRVDGVNPCDLLTTGDLSAALGRPVEGPTTNVDGYCSWKAPLGESVYADSISVNFFGAVEGEGTTIGGNSALVTRDENRCSTTVAVQLPQPEYRVVQELHVQLLATRDVREPRVQRFCGPSRELAELALQRLPAAEPGHSHPR